ncbi:hypothetical protein [Arcticibacterium luteifluviistationis]|uniref:Uncharacterized protein n=1 Tax=Arcticibacterium luteifluviistationis TaxID=1784714 RepID=A0A2Z4G8H3_9BACT|nr:hypothetical protein [Arcticibacterium luteifluviistationis]AWV97446.1 hypothetical protein DJ013_04375 [Arcticibacterium luteifluviistationis]
MKNIFNFLSKLFDHSKSSNIDVLISGKTTKKVIDKVSLPEVEESNKEKNITPIQEVNLDKISQNIEQEI